VWWLLPGPDEAVTRTAEAIREARCVIIETSLKGGRGFRSAVRDQVQDLDVHWETFLDDDLHGCGPLDAIAQRLVVEARHRLRTASDLAQHPDLARTLIWIVVTDAAVATRVSEFFGEFAHAATDREIYERPILVVEYGCETPPAQEVRAAKALHLELHGYSDWIDIRLFAAHQLRSRFSGDVLDLAAGVVASLAIWDFELVDYFAEREFECFLEPDETLREYAEYHSMVGGTWRDGSYGRIGMRDLRHSSLVLLNGDRAEIKRRLWRGQVGPLFTFLEERRVELLERFRPVLRVPFAVPVGDPITEIEDLEISHIKTLVDQSGSATREETYLLGDLKTLRHRLAHLGPVSAGDLSKPSLKAWWGQAFS
jgi:hypothetical protein